MNIYKPFGAPVFPRSMKDHGGGALGNHNDTSQEIYKNLWRETVKTVVYMDTIEVIVCQ